MIIIFSFFFLSVQISTRKLKLIKISNLRFNLRLDDHIEMILIKKVVL